ncbi:hypothetical protein BT96DRAFT_933998 [Gymnopus androsaceus JB14]|uniref:Cupin 2 conserved barrel domain-containing protein n=1 Tax=Gymnopus androsaceus JB14 TaxID=1447944 RepID=A0A6A4ICJ6_9AGAR|nr:hypothetical protein BT96DRAFT_933998 [Gymnopus androsaceus JB14]
MTSTLDYPESISLGKGITMTFEGHLRRVDVRAGEDDDVLIVPSHWHQDHDEVMHVLEGKIKITLGTQVTICTPETGDVFVPEECRIALESFKGVPCVVTERNEPLEFDKKELFFRNMGAIPGGYSITEMDFRVFLFMLAWMEKAFVTILGGYVAPLLGYRIKYENLKKR